MPDLTPDRELSAADSILWPVLTAYLPDNLLVYERKLGQTNLAVRTGQIGTSNATKKENLGLLDYVYLKIPFPDNFGGSEIHPHIPNHGPPTSYFLMRRCTDGFVSASGMFKAAFPWAKHSEEKAEKEYLKTLPSASREEVAGNIWVAEPTALELAEEYAIAPWILALLDPAPVEMAKESKSKSISPPPKYLFTANDRTHFPPPLPRASTPAKSRGRPRGASPTKSEKGASPRKPRVTKAMKAESEADTKAAAASLHEALAQATPTPSDENGGQGAVKVELIQTSEVKGDVETTTTNVKVNLPGGMAADIPPQEQTEEIIREAKAVVEAARELEGASSKASKKRKADELEEDSDNEAECDPQPAKRARLAEQQLKKERVKNRALFGVAAAMAIGNNEGRNHHSVCTVQTVFAGKWWSHKLDLSDSAEELFFDPVAIDNMGLYRSRAHGHVPLSELPWGAFAMVRGERRTLTGIIGYPMAQNLRAKIPESDTLIIHDQNREAARKFKEEVAAAAAGAGADGKGKGVEVAESSREVAEKSRVVITVLPEPSIVKSVFGNILRPRLSADSDSASDRLFIDCSTIDPTSSTDIANAVHSSSSGVFVDAPMSGGVVGARAATLTFMLGCPSHNGHGNGKLVSRVTPILHFMGKKVVHLGDSGMGLAGKLANNYLLAISNIATAEAMNLGVRLGVDPAQLADLINGSSGQCWSSSVNNPIKGVSPGAPVEKDFEGGFAVGLMRKDLGLAIKAARESGAELELAERAEKVYEQVEDEERGKDFSVVYRWLEGRNSKVSTWRAQ
ncbi:MAG: hypothetical protein Q9211_002041 [Gyalolechia sp. 1 TL-2023]